MRAAAVGEVRHRHAGFFVKLAPRKWKREREIAGYTALMDGLRMVSRKLSGHAKPGTNGVRELAAAIAAQRVFPTGELTILAGAFHDMLKRVRDKPNIVKASRALEIVAGDGGGQWQEYAARRMGTFNEGEVDMDVVPRFAARAREFHHDTLPAMDPVAKAYTGPTTVPDIIMASWNQFFDEGGALNQPRWLETDRLKELRHQFERLANLNR